MPLRGQCSRELYRERVKPPPLAVRENITAPPASHIIQVDNESYLPRRLTTADFTDVVKLLPSDGAAAHQFGASVAIDGHILAAGAGGDPSLKGEDIQIICLKPTVYLLLYYILFNYRGSVCLYNV